ncbi:PPPDE peptidase, putative [Plasmodium berghei]|uniref:PPPDE peptidase, putative n=2 Tax=Plasmodium berghei TaxID=5821 RepID=A0A509AH11_PLABA|nr:PPPDE peptidase, putative [Plasmodium berghei ANKA]CXI33298.1 PPPDE peptidase, putative [Plasmodium berghei]SCM21245.1 PPPDE peptidase, putative [Plasmodium berghei]SCN24543.1 PPPDE peptidase, putative [Plasmodium berghei]SCO59720.1 PPPDE peptidase, putative [Plasmodium berghei]SCO60938.1 PPPDE peptidase, putative [Plasmodium berghei]|eukprot:XP_034421173.1 PPPDE peptidase, putative [Plasmodium berghei ANKA]
MSIYLHTYILDVPFFLKNVRHTGIEVFGNEYTFSMDGIITSKPKRSGIGRYSKSYELESMKLTYYEFSEILNVLGKIYRPNTYNFIYKNCNHFCDDLFELLCGKRLLHSFMIYSRLGKFFGNFKNVAMCGSINTMDITKDDKNMYICALRLSKSILKKNKNIIKKKTILYQNKINEDTNHNFIHQPSYIIPYNPIISPNMYCNPNILTGSTKSSKYEKCFNDFSTNTYNTLYSLSTTDGFSFP